MTKLICRTFFWVLLLGMLGCATTHTQLLNDPNQQGCDEGNAHACQCAAYDTANGAHIKPSLFNSGETDWQPSEEDRQSLSDRFYEKACTLGDKDGCNKLNTCKDDPNSPKIKCARGDQASCDLLKEKAEADAEGAAKLQEKAKVACAYCGKRGYDYIDGKCSCGPDDPQQVEAELLYPVLKEWRQRFEGTKTGGIIDLRNQDNYDFTQFALTQMVNGYGIFHYVGSDANPSSKITVAVKRDNFSKEYTNGNMTYQITPSMGLPLSTAIVGKCLRYLKNETWETDSGFTMKVKTYEVTKCRDVKSLTGSESDF